LAVARGHCFVLWFFLVVMEEGIRGVEYLVRYGIPWLRICVAVFALR
jgi:hypothetical protein